MSNRPAHELLPSWRLRRLTGFGMGSASDGYVFRPTHADEIQEILSLARRLGRPIVLRGAGRSYGDANIGHECIVLDLTRMRRILEWDREQGVIVAEAGATIEDVWRYTLDDGYWPPVVSGTMYPTVGGALAMNIHGKNNFKVGTLGDNTLWIDVLFPNGTESRHTPDDPRFHEVISSAGLLGIILRVALRLKAVASSNLQVTARPCANWRAQFECFQSGQDHADYMVSWVDCFGRGRGAGRGLFHSAAYADGAHRPQLFGPDQDLPDTILGLLPKSVVWRALRVFNRRQGMRLINALKYASGARQGVHGPFAQSLVAFSFLLDYVPNWRQAYPHGFIQYQSFVPKERAAEVFGEQVARQQSERLESYLGVLKRHRPDRFLFSHGVDGYSLALDFKITPRSWPRLQAMCRQMNQEVLAAGGRFYLAKDSTLTGEEFQRSLGEAYPRYQALKAELDPEGILTSDLGRRLGLSR